MTPKQHMENIADWFKEKATTKYFRGQKEHGGKLWRKPALKLLGDEILDMPIYFRVLEEQQEEVLNQLQKALTKYTHNYTLWSIMVHVQKAYNILKVGNPEGIAEEER
jgi:hypothetical protein